MDPTVAAQLDEKRLDLIQSELDLAFTFLEVAEATGILAARERSIENARKACDEAEHLIEQGLVCTERQLETIRGDLAWLETRLKERTNALS
jgi:hypothetical protein